MTNVKRRTGGALLGLTVSVVLAASLRAVLVSRPVAGPASGATDVRLGWQAAARPPGAVPAARPVALGSGLVVLTSDGSAQVIGDVSASAWSSPDGSNWSRLSQPGAISEPGRSIMLVAACPDGRGALVAAGTSAIGADPSLALKTAIWHSSDGRTWDLATVDGDVGASVEDVAAGPGGIVAVGLAQPVNAGSARALAWYSSDGSTWPQASVSDSDGYSLLAVAAWQGELVSIGSGTGGRAAAWTSADGRSWTRVASMPEGFEAHRLVAFADRIVAVGSVAAKPESLASGDARTWAQAAMPLDGTEAQANAWVADAVELEGRLVAVGHSAIGVIPEATNVAPPRPLVWVSGDGLSWRLLPPDATLTGSLDGAAVLGNHVVVTTRDSAGSPIYVGTPAG
jgi:hypothetical protein